MTTRLEIENDVYRILQEENTSSVFTRASIQSKINTEVGLVCRGHYMKKDGGILKSPLLPFLKDSIYIKHKKTNILIDMTVLTHITVNSAVGFGEPGSLFIDGNYIDYAVIATNNFQSLIGAKYLHKAGSSVEKVYKLPSTAYALHSVKDVNGNDVEVEEDINVNGHYIRCKLGEKLIVTYQNKPVDMSDDGSACSIPSPYDMAILPYLVAGNLLYDTEEQQTGLGILNTTYQKMSDMYNNYAVPMTSRKRKVKVKFKFR